MGTDTKKKKRPDSGASRKVWNEGMYVKCYKLAKEGLNNRQIAKTIGISENVFGRWLDRYPYLAEGMKEARQAQTSNKATPLLQSFIYNRLPRKLQRLWDELEDLANEENALKKMQQLMEDKGTKTRQHLFLYALTNSHFNPSEACRAVGIPLRTVKEWARNDPDFGELMNEIHEHKRNFVEGHLMRLVEKGDVASTIFANKSLNTEVYGDRKELKVTGTINHTHTLLDLDKLGLPLELRRQILEHVTAAEEKILGLPAPKSEEDDEDVIDVEFTQKK